VCTVTNALELCVKSNKSGMLSARYDTHRQSIESTVSVECLTGFQLVKLISSVEIPHRATPTLTIISLEPSRDTKFVLLKSVYALKSRMTVQNVTNESFSNFSVADPGSVIRGARRRVPEATPSSKARARGFGGAPHFFLRKLRRLNFE